MGYFKVNADKEVQKPVLKGRQIEADIIPQRERLNVMGAIMHPIDQRNFMATIAVVNQFGQLVDHKDFLYLLPPKKARANRDNDMPRPGEEEERKKHEEDRRQF